jgi:hypothetical protein
MYLLNSVGDRGWTCHSSWRNVLSSVLLLFTVIFVVFLSIIFLRLESKFIYLYQVTGLMTSSSIIGLLPLASGQAC